MGSLKGLAPLLTLPSRAPDPGTRPVTVHYGPPPAPLPLGVPDLPATRMSCPSRVSVEVPTVSSTPGQGTTTPLVHPFSVPQAPGRDRSHLRHPHHLRFPVPSIPTRLRWDVETFTTSPTPKQFLVVQKKKKKTLSPE